MALDSSTLSNLMYNSFITPFRHKKTKEEFDCYAEGIVKGIKKGKATLSCTGLGGGKPGDGIGIGAIQGGPPALLTLLTTNALGVLPPKVGMVTPMQLMWYMAISQTALYLLTALEISAPADKDSKVCIGVGTTVFNISGSVIKQEIITALENKLDKTEKVTDMRKQMAGVIGKSIEMLMIAAICPVTISGGSPAGSPPPPVADVREGKIS